jgi:hypothetical protein
LLPLEIRSGSSLKEPYAIRTCLGWSIVGSFPGQNAVNSNGLTHSITLKVPKQVALAKEHTPDADQFVHRTALREVVSFPKVLDSLERDFVDIDQEGPDMSQKDSKPLKMPVSCSYRYSEGFGTMPLPSRDRESLSLLGNFGDVEQNLKLIQRKCH